MGHTGLHPDMSKTVKIPLLQNFRRTCIKTVIHAPGFYENRDCTSLHLRFSITYAPYSADRFHFLLRLYNGRYFRPSTSLPFSRRRTPSISNMVTRLITRGAGKPQRSINSSAVPTPCCTSSAICRSASDRCAGSAAAAAADGFSVFSACFARCSACSSRRRISSHAERAAGALRSPVCRWNARRACCSTVRSGSSPK